MSIIEEKSFPELRFEGFTEAWEQRKFFDNIRNTIDFRGRTPKKMGFDWSEKGYLALSALNVKNGYIDPSADAHYGDEELYNKWMGGNELRKGQVLFTTEAPMGNVAQVPDNKGYILSQRTIAFIVNEEKISNNFLAVLLSSPKVFNDLTSLSSGGTAKGVSRKSLSGLKVIVPKNTIEQEKIGSFIKVLEKAIALHQEKLDKLYTLKKGFLQDIFSQNEQQLPRLRVTDSDDYYTQRELSFMVERVKSYSLSRKYETSNKTLHKYIHYGDIHTKKVGIIDESTKLPNILPGNYDLLKSGDLILADASEDYQGIALPAVVNFKPTFNLVAGLHTIALRPKDIDSLFLYYLIHSSVFRKFGYKVGTGMKVFGISASNLLKFKVSFPSLEKQKIIGLFLKSLDNIIGMHQEKLEKLKKLKKSYLQKMFI